MRENFLWPRPMYIERSAETERLYKTEERRTKAILLCAKELQKLLNSRGHHLDFWVEALPQVLFDILETFEGSAAYRAAKVFVDNHEKKDSLLQPPKDPATPNAN